MEFESSNQIYVITCNQNLPTEFTTIKKVENYWHNLFLTFFHDKMRKPSILFISNFNTGNILVMTIYFSMYCKLQLILNSFPLAKLRSDYIGSDPNNRCVIIWTQIKRHSCSLTFTKWLFLYCSCWKNAKAISLLLLSGPEIGMNSINL